MDALTDYLNKDMWIFICRWFSNSEKQLGGR